jgi:hypothetical protein
VLSVACLAVALAAAGCGGAGQATVPAPTVPHRGDPTPARYRPGAPGCRARGAPGTVDEIGEDIGGSRAVDLIACFGAPVGRKATPRGPCLFYRQRGETVFWEFCFRRGRLVSAFGNRPGPEEPPRRGRA